MQAYSSDPEDEKSFDLSVFEQLKEELGEDIIGDLVKLYLDHTSGMVAQIPATLEASDYVELGKIAHGIKGASSNLGLVAVEGSARELEDCCKGDDQAAAPELANRLISNFEKAKTVLAPYAP